MITIRRTAVPSAVVALSLGTLSSLLLPASPATGQTSDLYATSDVQPGVDSRYVERTEVPLPDVRSMDAALFDRGAEPIDLGDPAERAARDRADDPPALLNQQPLGAIKTLAARLSADREWLSTDVLEALEIQSLRIDELFAGTPQLIRLEGQLYRIVVEKVGPLWAGFDASIDPFVVFLNHEIYDALGEDRAVAFENGDETVIFQWDFDRIPALALTLEGVAPDEEIPAETRIQKVSAPIRLGSPRLAVDRDTTRDTTWPSVALNRGLDELSSLAGAATCSPEIAPTSCASGKPVCGTAGYTPYFVLRALKIKDDHEGCCFKGDPEIELFPLRLDSTSPAGGTTNASTTLIFSGRTVSDLAGRSRFLPDVNSTNTWYTLTGLALFPTNEGNQWSATLVEDDDTAGVLKMSANKINLTKIYNTISSLINDSRKLDLFWLLKALGVLQDIIGLFNDGDDLYQESLGVANNLFCTNGVGQPFPKVFTLVSQEWELQGYFACVNPSCTTSSPPPPPDPCGGQVLLLEEPCL